MQSLQLDLNSLIEMMLSPQSGSLGSLLQQQPQQQQQTPNTTLQQTTFSSSSGPANSCFNTSTVPVVAGVSYAVPDVHDGYHHRGPS
jgi:hypothetical protein